MKKQTKLQILKGLVNDSLLERVKLCRYGVQAYNIVKGEEYAVIAAFAKQGGRYYFIDREDEQTAAEPSALAQKVTKVIFLFEHYIIKVDGTWCLMKNYRYNEYDKRKQLMELKRQGYKYNRKQKAYILESEPVESVYNYSVVIKKYYV